VVEVFVVSYSGAAAAGAPVSATFDAAGGTIGRGAGNVLTLSDPDRHLSRVQAKIVGVKGDSFEVSNLSRANSMFVGNNELEPLQIVVARVGVELRMGLYVLGTRPVKASVGEPVSVNDRADQVRVAAAPTGINAIPDPFADVLGAANVRASAAPPEPRAAELAQSMRATGASRASPSPRSASTRIPEDFDPFSMPSAVARNSDNPIHDLATSSDVSLRDVFEKSTRVNALIDNTPTPDKKDAIQPLFDDASSSLNDSVSSDPLKLFSGGAAGSGNANDPFAIVGVGNHASELNSFLTLPKVESFETTPPIVYSPTPMPTSASFAHDDAVLRPSILEVQPSTIDLSTSTAPIAKSLSDDPMALLASAPVVRENKLRTPQGVATNEVATKPAATSPGRKSKKSESSAPSSSLLNAFLEGAGVPAIDVPDVSDEEFMRRVGAMLRTSIDGAVDLISARASTKRELRADVTMIVSRGNNPIKFAPDGEAAAMQLLGTPFPGFMPPIDSMQDTYDDLRAHQIGVIAGSRAAFAEVLQRFDPQSLEDKLGAGGVLDSLMPSARKAKLWSLYTELFREILKQAEDDYGALFSEAFRRAYEEEVERVRSEKRDRGAR
jgi:FHA domain-containing protein